MSIFRLIHTPQPVGGGGRLNSPKKPDKIGVFGCFGDPNIWGYCQQKTTKLAATFLLL